MTFGKGQAAPEEYKDIITSCRDGIRKVKAQLKINLATAVKDNKKCFYKNINNKRRKPPSFIRHGGTLPPRMRKRAGSV